MSYVSTLLEQHGIRPTQQRVKVAEILLAAPIHLTADQLLASPAAGTRQGLQGDGLQHTKIVRGKRPGATDSPRPDRCVYDSSIAHTIISRTSRPAK